MDQEKNPVDLLDEILNRGQEEPRPSSYPPRFDPPLPENEPPPPEQKAPLRERAVPWLCGLLGGAAVTGLLCAVLLTSLNQRLDQLGAAVDEIRAVDELRERCKARHIKDTEGARQCMRDILAEYLDLGGAFVDMSNKPAVILFIGVNGVGKNNSIGKLAAHWKRVGRTVDL